MLPPPARRFPNLCTSQHDADIGDLAGDSMTSGGGERGVPGVTVACSSSTRLENVLSSGSSSLGHSCPDIWVNWVNGDLELSVLVDASGTPLPNILG